MIRLIRLTRKTNIKNNSKNSYYYENINNSTTVDVYNKLGSIEDLMEEYNINSVEELKEIIKKSLAITKFLESEWKVVKK